MKVKELIDILSKFDPDKTVVTEEFDPFFGRNSRFYIRELPDEDVDPTEQIIVLSSRPND